MQIKLIITLLELLKYLIIVKEFLINGGLKGFRVPPLSRKTFLTLIFQSLNVRKMLNVSQREVYLRKADCRN